MKKNSAQDDFSTGIALQRQGNLDLAESYILRALEVDPLNIKALNQLAIICAQKNSLEQSYDYFLRAYKADPNNHDTCFNIGNILQILNRHEEAIHYFNLSNEIDKNSIDPLIAKSTSLIDLKRHEEAADCCLDALEINNQSYAALNNLGIAYAKQSKAELAQKHYEGAISISPNYVDAHINLGSLFLSTGNINKAEIYFKKALAINPNLANGLTGMGNVLRSYKDFESALKYFYVAQKISPQSSEVLHNIGITLFDLKKYDEAISALKKSLDLNPDGFLTQGFHLASKLQICDWDDFDLNLKLLEESIGQGHCVAHPFIASLVSQSPSHLKKCSELFLQTKFGNILDNFHRNELKHEPNSKIRLGYFSGDFRLHPVSRLLAELFELHDRSKFEVIVFSYGPNTGDILRKRIETSADLFIDVESSSDEELVHISRSHNLDIAIDLSGHTEIARSSIFLNRIAPVQINYLGYPGTMGTSTYDYIVADHHIVPPGGSDNYSEQIIFLPGSYQINDRKRGIATTSIDRKEFNLPLDKFVFCCFNQVQKITPSIFINWMKILKNAKDSVLWLLVDDATAKNNLSGFALSQGVDPNRLIFAESIDAERHLARLALADLFLDTSPYNAHTTASDALWSGLPVLTFSEETFASRVGMSILYAANLPELVAKSANDYQQMAIHFANSPDTLISLRKRLALTKSSAPLFDTPTYVENLESAFVKAFCMHLENQEPAHISIEK